MTVYVDELLPYPGAKPPFDKGSCHLSADTLDELHEFAASIGMKRAWFQDHKLLPHYDLTPSRRAVAVHLGATQEGALEGTRRRRAAREQAP